MGKIDWQHQSNIAFVHEIIWLMEELKWADAVIRLRSLYLVNATRWFKIKDLLLRESSGRTEQAVTIIKASASEDLAAFFAYIPGLMNMAEFENNKKKELQQHQNSLKKSEYPLDNFWEKFCEDNPEEKECRIYEI